MVGTNLETKSRHTLNGEELALVRQFISIEDSTTEIVASRDNKTTPLRVCDLKSIVTTSTNRSAWLFDNAINNFGELLNDQSPATGVIGSFICLTSILFSKLVDIRNHYDDKSGVHSWYTQNRERNPLLRNFIHIPTNLSGCHWTGITIDTRRRHIFYVDPMGSLTCGKQQLYFIRRWLGQEIATQMEAGGLTTQEAVCLGNPALWSYELVISPQQLNGIDCGLFYICWTLYHAQQRKPTYSQGDMKEVRRQVFIALYTQRIPPLIFDERHDISNRFNILIDYSKKLGSLPRPPQTDRSHLFLEYFSHEFTNANPLDLTIPQYLQTLQHPQPDAYTQHNLTIVEELEVGGKDDERIGTFTHTYTQSNNSHTSNTNKYDTDLEVNFDAMGASYRIGEVNFWEEEEREGVG